ncbi:MAG: Lipoprotein-releasing system ATP-binding protein LolD [Turneriella sp.]|nr:Lipoprotein-releasing system ATP-binding protein LolD [Turneriella sp.]
MIRISDVHIAYTQAAGPFLSASEEVNALNGVTLDINENNYVAIVGPSGSGKSTLVTAIAGLITLRKGDIFVDKYRLNRSSRARQAKIRAKYFGIIFQFSEMLSRFTVEENLRFSYVAAHGQIDENYNARLKHLSAALDLYPLLSAFPGKLSGGQLQKTAIARALIKDSSFILADEPSGDLDPESVLRVKKLFQEEHVRGKGILLVTHDNKFASDATSVFEMRSGKISAHLK